MCFTSPRPWSWRDHCLRCMEPLRVAAIGMEPPLVPVPGRLEFASFLMLWLSRATIDPRPRFGEATAGGA
jgi:hypothetical protein